MPLRSTVRKAKERDRNILTFFGDITCVALGRMHLEHVSKSEYLTGLVHRQIAFHVLWGFELSAHQLNGYALSVKCEGHYQP